MKLLILLLFCLNSIAQDRASIGIYQDPKILFLGDAERGIKPYTTNILVRVNMQGHQNKHGYFMVFPEFEFADIPGSYKRYSANVGYVFNKLINKIESGLTFGWGWIDRFNTAGYSFGASAVLSYKISNWLKLSIISQITERKDLKILYNNNVLRYSGFIGIELNF